jgi:hypothetical protein
MPPLLRLLSPATALLLLAAAARFTLAAEVCTAGGAARSAEITLTAADFFDPDGEEMRTFVDTGSLGAVNASLVSARPRGVVRSFTAVPARSLLSPYFGEDLKGIDVTVSLNKSRRSPVVRLRLQQDCAKYLHNSFLYY